MTEMFDNYEQEFKNMTATVGANIQSLPGVPRGDDRDKAMTTIQKEITEAESLVQQMDLEVRSMTGATRSELQSRVRGYKSTLQDLRTRFTEARAAFPTGIAARQELLGSGPGGRPSPELTAEAQTQRQRLLAQTDALGKTSTRLEETHRICLETEEIGSSILSDLGQQRETLEGTRDRLRGADVDLARSRRILKSMARRAMANKFIMVGIIITLIGFIALIVYIQWFAGDGEDKPDAPAPAGGD